MNEILRFKIEETFILWQEFCQLHNNLYKFTCDEYIHLLSSDIDKLESTLAEKDQIILDIKLLEEKRLTLIQEINAILPTDKKIEKVSQLIRLISETENNKGETRIEKLNKLLVDIIEKIQSQNKKNQLFLNKAILSLQDLKE